MLSMYYHRMEYFSRLMGLRQVGTAKGYGLLLVDPRNLVIYKTKVTRYIWGYCKYIIRQPCYTY